MCKAYQLSGGNPIQDTIDMFVALRQQVESQGATLEVLGVGTTGYAKDVLKDVLKADVALVETVAHTESAMKFYKNPHVIVDVGGQDIKLIVLKDGRVKDFKLNTQCSAGNGYFLQGTAESLGYKVEEYADIAFSAKTMPIFGYGCAVFMQSDIVNFQRQGWRGEEILAGLANVLPKNIFLYVAGIPNLAKLGSRFILQGGTQKNLAAVKSEVDFIHSHFHGAGHEPEVIVHEHCGESGAIGAGVEAIRLYKNGHRTTFIGLEAVQKIGYRTTRNEDTRCYFCKNNCLRTFIDVNVGDILRPASPLPVFKSKVPLQAGERRLIISTCEKGQVEDVGAMRGIKAGLDAVKKENPNFVDIAAHEVWRSRNPQKVADPIPTRAWTSAGQAAHRADEEALQLAHRHATRAEHVPVRAAVQRLPGELGHGAGEPGLLRVHRPGHVSRGRRPRRHRSVLPVEDRHPACLQPDLPEAREEAAGRHLLPHDRHHASAAEELQRQQRLPDGDRNAECREGGVHQGE